MNGISVLLESRDPASGEVVGVVPITPVEVIPDLVARSRAAQEGWGRLSAAERARRLEPLAAALEERAEELAPLLTREMGKPLARSLGEIKACSRGLHGQLAEMVEALAPETLENDKVRAVIHRDPFGVCAAITPWNYPVSMPHWLVIPALVAGNSVVLKPSEETPLVGQAYAEMVRALVPEDVLIVVHGDEAQGRALVAADVDLIAFTGSGAAGKQILRSASDGLKRVLLELGGKDPQIVLEGADLAAAAAFAAASSFENSGQACVSTERIYVVPEVAEEFVERLREAAEGYLPIGHGLEEASRLGPLVNERQSAHVRAQIEDAISRGAEVVFGGEGHAGNFVVPTVLAGVTPEMQIARDETFGPVACVTVVRDAEEAVRLANDSPYALGGSVWGEAEEAGRWARRLTSGMVGVNRGVGGVAGTPWVGARQSGYGFHHSRDGHRQFAQTRVVSAPKAGETER